MKIAIVFHPRRLRVVEEKIYGRLRRVVYPTLNSVRNLFKRMGHKVVTIDGTGNLYAKVKRVKPDLVFNWFSIPGRAQAYVPALLEKMDIPCTGCSALCHSLAMHKGLTAKILRYDKLPIPPFALVSRKRRKPSRHVEFPVLVKPCSLGASEGISDESFVTSEEELQETINKALDSDKEAVITKYIPGREMTVGLLGNRELQILPFLEKHFQTKPGMPRIFTEKMKERTGHWHDNVSVPKLTVEEEAAVKKVARRAYHSLGCTDFARVDIRLDKKGIPWILELNTMPGIYPKFSSLHKMAMEMGKGTKYLAKRILEAAIERYGLQQA
jgi:D-alanine-D-alanine ligase